MTSSIDPVAISQYSQLQKVDPDAYKFLVLQDKVTQSKTAHYSLNNQQEIHLKQLATSLGAFVVNLNCFSMNYFSATGFSFCAGLLARRFFERRQAEEVDEIVIQKANIKQLKGGIRFYAAWQQALQKKANNGYWNLAFFTRSGESRCTILEATPALKGRINKLKCELNDLGVEWQPAEEDKIIIERIKNLFDSNV